MPTTWFKSRYSQALSGARADGTRRWIVATTWLLAATLSLPLPLFAQGLRVKSRTNIWVDVSEQDGLLRGYLEDDIGDRLPRRQITITCGDTLFSAVTNSEGTFEVPFPLGMRSQNIVIQFVGDPFHEPSSLERLIDPSRLPIRIQLIMPTVVSLSDGSVEAQIHASHDGRPIEIDVQLTSPHISSSLGEGSTGSDGWASIAFDPRALNRPGLHHVHAEFDGNAHLAPSMERSEVFLVDRPELVLSVSPLMVLPDESFRFRGSLTGVFTPLGGQEITLEVGTTILAQTMTDVAGSYEFRLKGSDFPETGRSVVFTRYKTQTKIRSSAESQPLSVEVQEPQPLNWKLVVIPGAVTAVLLFVILLLTRKRLDRSSDSPARPSMAPLETGLRTSLVPHRAIRRPERYDFSGRVVDPVDERPVSGAVVSVDGDSQIERAQTDHNGDFEIGPLGHGVRTVTISASGYVAEVFEITIPHSGSFSHVTVNIVQIRHRALEIYQNIAKPLLPRQALWGRWTPREVAVHSVKHYPWLSDEIAELTSFFETLYYSPSITSVEDLNKMRHLASSLRRTDEDHPRPG